MVVFVVVTSLASIFIATGASIAVPRLLTQAGCLRDRRSVTSWGSGCLLRDRRCRSLAAPGLAGAIGGILEVDSGELTGLLLIGTVFFASTVGVGLGGDALATGHRFR